MDRAGLAVAGSHDGTGNGSAGWTGRLPTWGWEARTSGRRVSANVERGRRREMGRGRDYWLPIGTVLMTRTQPTWLSAVRTLIQVVPPESVA